MNYRKVACYFAGLLTLFSACQAGNNHERISNDLIKSQLKLLAANFREAKGLPAPAREDLVTVRSLNSDGSLNLIPSKDWCSGFYAGSLWMGSVLTGDKELEKLAEEFTKPLEKEKFNGKTHDMGFKMFCSFGQGYKVTNDSAYRNILIQSAKTLSKRFNDKVGALRSWDHNADKWQYPVIIDNMMNIELLFWASRQTGDQQYYNIAVKHAETTLANHFRADNSSYHVIDYDTITGKVLKKNTHQGYSDSSAWARGQAWGLYGFTMCYRETKNTTYLLQAKKIADYILGRLPAGKIPYWDYDAPAIPNEPMDASAAAITASALYELSTYMDDPVYRKTADELLEKLCAGYLSPVSQNNGFILLHSTGHKPAKSEIDVPLIYADYYFLESLMRSEKLKEKKPLFKN